MMRLMPFNLDGFEAFVPIVDVDTAPAAAGVYVVVRRVSCPPVFLPVSSAGRWKDNDPTLPITELQRSWVPDEPVLYIGSAAAGGTGQRGLGTRLDELRRYGTGQAAPHEGGRMIWRLADRAQLLVGWRLVDDPVAVKQDMLDEFCAMHDTLPFANRKR